jgi:hypothetical protein
VNLSLIDWIWRVRGSLALAPGQSVDDAFDRLDSLFRQTGTSHQRTTDALVFSKTSQAAQDKMSVFDGGVLRIDQGPSGSVLRYHLTSRALLFCFLAPLLFLSIAQFTIFISKFDKPPHEIEKKHETPQLNPIDKFLGAPAPDESKAPGKAKKGDADKSEAEDDKLTPTPAYIFAGLFGTLYIFGRILEDRLVKRLFKRLLLEG